MFLTVVTFLCDRLSRPAGRTLQGFEQTFSHGGWPHLERKLCCALWGPCGEYNTGSLRHSVYNHEVQTAEVQLPLSTTQVIFQFRIHAPNVA